MMKNYYMAILWILLGCVFGCEKESVEVYEGPEDQPVLFEYRYVNHAWAYSELGWLIDSNGDVHYYSLPEDFRLPDSTSYLSHEDLLHNLAQADSSIHGLEAEDLEYYTGLIAAAAEGKIGKVESVAADAGGSVLSCYMYDAHKDMYRYVFLASSGDWQQSNESNEAKILVEWMKDFGVFWISR
jgi:hypothetical protein